MSVTQALASPLSGIFGDKHDRMLIIAGGCVIWGVMTSAIAASVTVNQVIRKDICVLKRWLCP